MLVIGIDENGLGPLLGPLVVTATAFEVPTYSAETFWETAGRDLVAGDSKQVFSSSKLGSAEVATLAWLNEFGRLPTSHVDLSDQVFAPVPLPLPCHMVPSFCTPSATPLPAWAKPKDIEWIKDHRVFVNHKEVRPVAAKVYAICPGMFNAATSSKRNKLSLDCLLMLKLFQSLANGYEGEVVGLFGKVGSTKNYGPWLQDANVGLWMMEKEEREISAYRIAPNRSISFIRDGDASHLPIAVASMIGKYVRELAMRDLNTLLFTPGARKTSGYHNRITNDFVEKSKKIRETIGLDDRCFLRNS